MGGNAYGCDSEWGVSAEFDLGAYTPELMILEAEFVVRKTGHEEGLPYVAVFAYAATGDEVVLLDAADTIVDLMSFGTPPLDADPVLGEVERHPGVQVGNSMHRFPETDDTNHSSQDFVEVTPSRPGDSASSIRIKGEVSVIAITSPSSSRRQTVGNSGTRGDGRSQSATCRLVIHR